MHCIAFLFSRTMWPGKHLWRWIRPGCIWQHWVARLGGRKDIYKEVSSGYRYLAIRRTCRGSAFQQLCLHKDQVQLVQHLHCVRKRGWSTSISGWWNIYQLGVEDGIVRTLSDISRDAGKLVQRGRSHHWWTRLGKRLRFTCQAISITKYQNHCRRSWKRWPTQSDEIGFKFKGFLHC